MSKTLEELGYEKVECDEYVAFGGKDKEILFDKQKREFTVPNEMFAITMEELKAIYQYCIDNKWIDDERYNKGYQDGFKQAKFDCEMDKLDGR